VRDQPSLPEWANFFKSRAQLDRFERLVLNDFRHRRIKVAVDDGWAKGVEPPHHQHAFGLSNLGQTCSQEKESAWPTLITAHFDRVLASIAGEDERAPLDWKTAASMVAVRLFDPQQMSLPDETHTRTDIEGLRTTLVIDEGGSIRSVTREESKAWGVSEGELFARALENVDEQTDAEVHIVPDPEGKLGPLKLITGDGFYNHTLALSIDRFEGVIGAHGALVAVPVRTMILCATITDTRMDDDLQRVAFFADKFHRDGPGSVSPRVWWVRRVGTKMVWQDLNVTRENGALGVSPSAEFMKMRKALPAPAPRKDRQM
jgi:hypothetical protein